MMSRLRVCVWGAYSTWKMEISTIYVINDASHIIIPAWPCAKQIDCIKNLDSKWCISFEEKKNHINSNSLSSSNGCLSSIEFVAFAWALSLPASLRCRLFYASSSFVFQIEMKLKQNHRFVLSVSSMLSSVCVYV